MKADRAALKAYLDNLSAVQQAEYGAWNKPQKLAFLLNAYNAFTVDLVLTGYPGIKSIKDLGSFISSPWKKKFFTLLGGQRSLDDVEHGLIRAPGAFDDPRIHMAANCASVGCPALRNEAYSGDKLDAQLEDGVARFLSDHTRNRFNAEASKLEVSKIFDWYGKDFAARAGSLEAWLAKYAVKLSDEPKQQQIIRDSKAKIDFLDYDWALNDLKK